MRFFRGRERAKEEGLRSAYPEAWLAGENLANHLFRDMVFCGMEPGGERGRRKDLEEAAESQADEARTGTSSLGGSSAAPSTPTRFGRSAWASADGSRLSSSRTRRWRRARIPT
jgi:hypothetical protein